MIMKQLKVLEDHAGVMKISAVDKKVAYIPLKVRGKLENIFSFFFLHKPLRSYDKKKF